RICESRSGRSAYPAASATAPSASIFLISSTNFGFRLGSEASSCDSSGNLLNRSCMSFALRVMRAGPEDDRWANRAAPASATTIRMVATTFPGNFILFDLLTMFSPSLPVRRERRSRSPGAKRLRVFPRHRASDIRSAALLRARRIPPIWSAGPLPHNRCDASLRRALRESAPPLNPRTMAPGAQSVNRRQEERLPLRPVRRRLRCPAARAQARLHRRAGLPLTILRLFQDDLSSFSGGTCPLF